MNPNIEFKVLNIPLKPLPIHILPYSVDGMYIQCIYNVYTIKLWLPISYSYTSCFEIDHIEQHIKYKLPWFVCLGFFILFVTRFIWPRKESWWSFILHSHQVTLVAPTICITTQERKDIYLYSIDHWSHDLEPGISSPYHLYLCLHSCIPYLISYKKNNFFKDKQVNI